MATSTLDSGNQKFWTRKKQTQFYCLTTPHWRKLITENLWNSAIFIPKTLACYQENSFPAREDDRGWLCSNSVFLVPVVIHMLLKRMLKYLYSFFGQGNPSSLVDVVVLVHIFSFVCFCHREKWPIMLKRSKTRHSSICSFVVRDFQPTYQIDVAEVCVGL